MKTIQLELFSFDELSDDAKQTAIEAERNSENLDYFFDGELDYFKNGALTGTGFVIDDVSFSGFYSQGDGASFTGYYDSSLLNVDKLNGFDPKVYTLMTRIDSIFGASGLTSDNVITADVKRISHHYSHENTVSIANIEINGVTYDDCDDKTDAALNAIYDYLTELKDSLCHIIYDSLQKEYEYQNSDEYIAELLRINDYYFLADGTFYQ